MRSAILLLGALAVSTPDAAQAAPAYALEDTVVLQRGWSVLAYRDLDGDGRPELVVTTGDHRRIEIYERRDRGFHLVTRLSTPSLAVGYDTIGDVDEDGFPEIVLRGRRSGELYLVEASGDDRYRLVRFPIAPIDDPTCIADTDGDGRLEVIASQPGFPSRIHRFEAIDNDRYASMPAIDGVGGSVRIACARSAGDPIQLVFADNHFWLGVQRGTWLASSGARGQWPRLGFFPVALTDTDGDGRAELIGEAESAALVIADLADRRRPRIVLRDPDGTCARAPGDYDSDGRVELLCTPMIDGARRVMLRARRGDRLVTIWEGGSLLPASGAAMRAVPAGDWNGDGRLEIMAIGGGAAPRLWLLMSVSR